MLSAFLHDWVCVHHSLITRWQQKVLIRTDLNWVLMNVRLNISVSVFVKSVFHSSVHNYENGVEQLWDKYTHLLKKYELQ